MQYERFYQFITNTAGADFESRGFVAEPKAFRPRSVRFRFDELYWLAKEEGAVCYVVMFYGSTAAFERLREKVAHDVQDAARALAVRTLVMFHVVVESDEHAEEALEIMRREAVEYAAQPFYEIYLSIDLTGGRLFACDSQPHNIAGVSGILANRLKHAASLTNEPPMSLGETVVAPEAVGEAIEVKAPPLESEIVEPEQRVKRVPPLLAYSLIFMNVAVFIFMIITDANGFVAFNGETLLIFGALNKTLVFDYGEFYRVLTAIFIHVGLSHLAFNCLSIYIFASRMEKRFGPWVTVSIYALSGIAGNALMLLTSGDADISAGASGAVFGLMGASLAVVWVDKASLEGLNLYALLLLAVSGIGIGFAMPNIGNAAHLGGFAVGLALTALWQYMSKREKRAVAQ